MYLISALAVQLDGSPIVVAQNDKFDGEQLLLELVYTILFLEASLYYLSTHNV